MSQTFHACRTQTLTQMHLNMCIYKVCQAKGGFLPPCTGRGIGLAALSVLVPSRNHGLNPQPSPANSRPHNFAESIEERVRIRKEEKRAAKQHAATNDVMGKCW